MGTVNFSRSKKARVSVKSLGRCWYCGCGLIDTPTYHPLQLTLDHLIPRSVGGTNEDENLVFACRRCNCRKLGRNLEEYRYLCAFSVGHHKARKSLEEAALLLTVGQAVAISHVLEWIETQKKEVVFYGETLAIFDDLPKIEAMEAGSELSAIH